MSKLRDYLFPMKQGAKIYPEDLAGMIGKPVVGNVIYVDAVGGSDGNDGRELSRAFKTFDTAVASLANNNYDVIVIAPKGTSGTADTESVTISQNHVTVIGAGAPVSMSSRSRITWDTDSVDPCLTISGSDVSIINLQLATYQASNDVLVAMTGDRNLIQNSHLAGIGHADTGDDTTARILSLNGAEENDFVGVTFGTDKIMRSAANASVEFAGASSDNTFTGCRFLMAADAATPTHVLFTGTSAIDRWVNFDNCLWYSFSANNATPLTACMNLSAQTATGHVLLTGNQLLAGITDWEATASGRIYMQRYTETANVMGVPINPTVS
jgi:hypothetical protein